MRNSIMEEKKSGSFFLRRGVASARGEVGKIVMSTQYRLETETRDVRWRMEGVGVRGNKGKLPVLSPPPLPPPLRRRQSPSHVQNGGLRGTEERKRSEGEGREKGGERDAKGRDSTRFSFPPPWL